jgi:hypothetical protein
MVGSTTKFPSLLPILIPAIGPFQGTEDIESAADAQIKPNKSGSLS